jgi:hypothetical protein
MYADEGDCDKPRTRHYSKIKIYLEEIQTVLVFLEDFLEICTNLLKKIVGGGQGKQKYPARKCRAHKKRSEMCPCGKCILFCAFPQRLIFPEISHTQPVLAHLNH